MLETDWITRHAGDFDVLHVHFGIESFSIAALSSALDALAAAGRPLIYTVHDLENPQLAGQSHHVDQLDLLIPRASELITLTHGAAAEIRRRWGRVSTVIAHPRRLDLDLELSAPAELAELRHPSPSPFTVGLHLRDLRPSIDGPGAARGLAGAIDRLGAAGIEAQARVVLSDHPRDGVAAEQVRAIAATAPHVSLIQQPRASDGELAADLGALHVSLLPYRHGTHSGWAELCWDLAVPVVGAPVGYVIEQHDDPGWFTAADPTDARSLAAALSGLARGDPPGSSLRPGSSRAPIIAARRQLRIGQAGELARLHRVVYLRALGRSTP
jgi:hypothetical protein